MIKQLLRKTIEDKFIPDKWLLPYFFLRSYLTGGIEPELYILKKFKATDGVVIDIGANNGVYSYCLSKWFHKVISFEPNPRITKALKNYDSAKIHLHAVALSDQPGAAELRVPVSGTGVEYAGWGSLEQNEVPLVQEYVSEIVQLRTLDSYQLSKVAAIKIDAEGHEVKVLRGAVETISRNRPVIMIEVKLSSRPAVVEVFDYLQYSLYAPQEGTLTELNKNKFLTERYPENVFALPNRSS